MGRFAHRFLTLGIVVLLGVSSAWAQQQQQGQTQQSGQQTSQQPTGQNASSPQAPLPPLSQSQSRNQQQSEQQGQSQAASVPSSAPPLTGAEQYMLSRLGAGRSYFIPSIQFAQSVSTSGTGAFGTASVDAVSTISGLFAFHHLWRRYELTAEYTGTGFLYNQQSSLNSSAHGFLLSQQIRGRRSSFLLADAVSYLPEASFGYARFSGINGVGAPGYGYGGGLYGVNGGNLDTTFLPSQSILTGPSSRVSNSVVGEYDYLTSPRSSLTFTGSYALLEFPGSGYINNSDAVFRFGYNRTITRKDTVALSYQAGIFRYGQGTGDFTDHVVAFTYGHVLTDRLSLQLGAGPSFSFENNVPGGNSQVSWNVSSSLEYQFRRFALNTSYQHYTSGGSGVYRGANTDFAQVYISTALTRMWSTNWDLGYAHNTSLQSVNAPGTGNSYNSWYGSVNFQRVVNRWMSLFLGYNLQQQLSGVPSCIGSTCGNFYTQQYFSLGLNWHPSRLGSERSASIP